MERTNLRHLALKDLPGQQAVDVVTLDLSFISLLTVMPAICGLLRPGGDLVTLIKPHFEAARHQVPHACDHTDAHTGLRALIVCLRSPD